MRVSFRPIPLVASRAPGRSRVGILPAFFAIALLVRAPVPAVASDARESLLLAVRPGHEIALRIVSEPMEDLRLLLTSRARHSGHSIRVGLATPRLVVGPLSLSGIYAGLENPMGATASSDRWFTPGRIALDGSLVPATRSGVTVRPFPWAEAFAWRTDTLVIGAALCGTVERGAASAHLQLAGSSSRPLRPEDPDPRDRSWFEDRRPTEPVEHALGRLVVVARPLRLSLGATASLPRLTMPGLLLLSAAELRPARHWTVAAAGALSSPDFTDTRGRRPGDSGRWSASVVYDGHRLGAAVEQDTGYAGTGQAYPRVGFPWALEPSRRRLTGRISVRPVRDGSGLRSVAADGRYEGLTHDWQVRLHGRLVGPREIVELHPAATLRSDRSTALRLRAVAHLTGAIMDRLVHGSSLQVSLVGEHEGRPDREGKLTSSVEIAFRASR